MGALLELNRSLDQELQALLRGASLECLVCGEFVLRLPDASIFCPECGSALESEAASVNIPLAQPGVQGPSG
jgi:predicted amidophosphoribosyltransferase